MLLQRRIQILRRAGQECFCRLERMSLRKIRAVLLLLMWRLRRETRPCLACCMVWPLPLLIWLHFMFPPCEDDTRCCLRACALRAPQGLMLREHACVRDGVRGGQGKR